MLIRFCRNFSGIGGGIGNKIDKNGVVQVFDRLAKRRQRIRANLTPESSAATYLHEEVGWRLADRVFDIKKTFDVVADIGFSF